MTPNERLADAMVSHAIGLQRLSTATVRKVLAELRRADSRIVERLSREDLSQASQKRQAALLRDIRAILDAVYIDATGKLQVDMEELAEYEARYLGDVFKRVIPDVDFTLPTSNQLHAAINSRPFQGRLMRDWFGDMTSDAKTRVQQTVRQGIVEGRSLTQMIRDVRGAQTSRGVFHTNRTAAEVVVRTTVAHVANAARERTYKQNTRLIRGVEWVSVLDSRTSRICAARDGNVYDVDGGPRPPAHPRCRSTTTPLLRGDSSRSGTRTYGAWLKSQPVSVQNEVLGKTAAILYRKGELSIDKFVDNNGRGYSLDELRQREREAWESAGLDA